MTLSFGTQKSGEDGIVILACQGQIVAGREGSELREKVQQLLKYTPNVVLDLGEISYIDSSGLGVLVSLYSTARAAGGKIKFENLVTPVTYIRPTSLAS
ncbi:MAG TPA: STAS domain-containing protein [Terriglobales bacterium]|nr:STAS domain-containing protein [Terriglobales bacterium]